MDSGQIQFTTSERRLNNGLDETFEESEAEPASESPPSLFCAICGLPDCVPSFDIRSSEYDALKAFKVFRRDAFTPLGHVRVLAEAEEDESCDWLGPFEALTGLFEPGSATPSMMYARLAQYSLLHSFESFKDELLYARDPGAKWQSIQCWQRVDADHFIRPYTSVPLQSDKPFSVFPVHGVCVEVLEQAILVRMGDEALDVLPAAMRREIARILAWEGLNRLYHSDSAVIPRLTGSDWLTLWGDLELKPYMLVSPLFPHFYPDATPAPSEEVAITMPFSFNLSERQGQASPARRAQRGSHLILLPAEILHELVVELLYIKGSQQPTFHALRHSCSFFLRGVYRTRVWVILTLALSLFTFPEFRTLHLRVREDFKRVEWRDRLVRRVGTFDKQDAGYRLWARFAGDPGVRARRRLNSRILEIWREITELMKSEDEDGEDEDGD